MRFHGSKILFFVGFSQRPFWGLKGSDSAALQRRSSQLQRSATFALGPLGMSRPGLRDLSSTAGVAGKMLLPRGIQGFLASWNTNIPMPWSSLFCRRGKTEYDRFQDMPQVHPVSTSKLFWLFRLNPISFFTNSFRETGHAKKATDWPLTWQVVGRRCVPCAGVSKVQTWHGLPLIYILCLESMGAAACAASRKKTWLPRHPEAGRLAFSLMCIWSLVPWLNTFCFGKSWWFQMFLFIHFCWFIFFGMVDISNVFLWYGWYCYIIIHPWTATDPVLSFHDFKFGPPLLVLMIQT